MRPDEAELARELRAADLARAAHCPCKTMSYSITEMQGTITASIVFASDDFE
jgi:hypothetical protein